MRKITAAARHAFLHGEFFKSGNTGVDYRSHRVDPDDLRSVHVRFVYLTLFGNAIARYTAGDTTLRSLEITTAGWNTTTTRDRLNCLPDVRVGTRKGELYLNGKPWDGEWTNVEAWNRKHVWGTDHE